MKFAMNETCNKPLLTFVVLAYNQEGFIEEAIEGAFSQTYAPLEIILSDDCSKDRTFDIMREKAQLYRGPHKVILNRNEKNLGLVSHVNRVVDLATAEMIVGAAGDDISLPERCQLTAEAWEASGWKATSIHGRRIVIDKHGCSGGEDKWSDYPPMDVPHLLRQPVEPLDFIRTRKPSVQGNSPAFAKRLFTEFGLLPGNVTNEDTALGFRSVLAGEIHFINRPLTKYRRHGDNTFASMQAKRLASVEQLRVYHGQIARDATRMINLYDSFRADVQTLERNGKICADAAAELNAEIVNVQHRHRLMFKLFDTRFMVRLRATLALIKLGYEGKYALGRLLPRLLSESIFRAGTRLRQPGSVRVKRAGVHVP